MRARSTPDAKRAYDALAPCYDEFTHGYQYERWTGRLLERAQAAGLPGSRLLDVGCGTGLSFVAMLSRGFEVTACDISPEMVERARVRADDQARLLTADMRELPTLGEFDLVWAVNDAVNYLLGEEELEAALEGMRRNLASGGVILFDVNTLATYRSFFTKEHVVERDGKVLVWRGMMSAEEVSPGSICEARFEGDGVEPHVHRQRHFPEATVLAAIEAAGLRCVEVTGELEGELSAPLDEERDTKAVYVGVAIPREG
jgi:SAM-dependent methyltransferase